jgi:hypothetical protein
MGESSMHDGPYRNGHLPKRLQKYDLLLRNDSATDSECCEALFKILKLDCYLPPRLVEGYRNDLFPDEMISHLDQEEIEITDFARNVIYDLQFASFDTLLPSSLEKLEASVLAALKSHLNGIAQEIEAGCLKDARQVMERCERIKSMLLKDGEIVKQLCQTGRISKTTEKHRQGPDDHIPGAAL